MLDLVGPQLNRLRGTAIVMAVIGLVLTIVGGVMDPAKAFQSYLVGWLFWGGVSIGSLALLMLHHTVGGGWGWVLRRFLEAGTKLLPVMLVLLLPVILPVLAPTALPPSMSTLWWGEGGWAHASAATDHILQQKAMWLNPIGFVVRSLIYFGVWIAFATVLRNKAAILDQRRDARTNEALNKIGAGGLVVMVVTITFAVVDWIMTLTPHWLSSIIGLLYCACFALGATALMLALIGHLGKGTQLIEEEVPNKFFRDLGNLMLAMVMLWAYMSFSQYLIIYSANIAEEAPWYLHRARNGWGIISLGLIAVHFALPFTILLIGSRIKKSPRALGKVALWIVLMRFLDLYWWVVPTFRDSLLGGLNPADFGAPLLLGGIWLTVWSRSVENRPLVSIHDPRVEANLHEVVSHHG
jgi:hypothetical protein